MTTHYGASGKRRRLAAASLLLFLLFLQKAVSFRAPARNLPDTNKKLSSITEALAKVNFVCG
jgi:hypothetical protein